MFRLSLSAVFAIFCSASVMAQTVGNLEDHDALRQLKDNVVKIVNDRDYDAAHQILHEPFMATLITQDSFTEFEKVKNYFEALYTRDFLRMKKVAIAAEADDQSWIYQGTFAINKGTTKEHYELADGRSFDMDGRWTAVSMKENGEWRLLAIHTGTNFLDNPVISAIEKSVAWTGMIAGAAGLLVGFVAGWFLKRRRISP